MDIKERVPMIRTRLRRLYVPNAVYFITGVTRDRNRVFTRDGTIALLRQTMRAVKEIHPFGMRAYVFLHDHLHLLLYVPETSNISRVMQSTKRNFTLNYKDTYGVSDSISLWQPRFWDHVIRDETDFAHHLDYIHWNPVKHGYVTRPADYPHSSFHEYVRRGWYDLDWGQVEPETVRGLDFE